MNSYMELIVLSPVVKGIMLWMLEVNYPFKCLWRCLYESLDLERFCMWWSGRSMTFLYTGLKWVTPKESVQFPSELEHVICVLFLVISGPNLGMVQGKWNESASLPEDWAQWWARKDAVQQLNREHLAPRARYFSLRADLTLCCKTLHSLLSSTD